MSDNADPQEQILLMADRIEYWHDEINACVFLDIDISELKAISKQLKAAVKEMRKNTRNAIITKKVSIS